MKIANPLKTVYGVGPQITVCPSGLICGRIAKNSDKEEAKQFTQPGNEIYGLLAPIVQ